ncbi:27856_t:CDS:2, partial [Racocetra persica]
IEEENAHCIQLPPNPSTHCGLNKVGNFMKDIGQEVKDTNISEDTIMNITRHKSLQGVRAYKNVNESQKINMIKILINFIEPNQEPSTVLTEITRSHINFNTNTITNAQDVNMVQGQIY